MVSSREKKGLEARRVPDIESLVDVVDRVHYIVILLLHSCSTPYITAEAIFTNSSRNVHRRTVTWVGGGGGEVRIPPAAPNPLTVPYMLLYICTVNELCSRSVGEYRHWAALSIGRRYSTTFAASTSTGLSISP